MKEYNNLVVTFVHSNYCLMSAGTEKFVREYSALLKEKNYNNLTFFSMAKRKTKQLVGVIYNDCFIGLYPYVKIKDCILGVMSKYSLSLNSICIQHLKNHELKYLSQLIYELNVPVNIFIHDYYSLCINSRMINSDGKSCGFAKPCEDKCRKCLYYTETREHIKENEMFYKGLYEYIENVIVPSEFVRNIVNSAFPYLGNKMIIRPHLKFKGHMRRNSIINKIRIAYVGAQIVDKGYTEWVKLVDYLAKNYKEYFEFYYFGFGTEKNKYVNNVYVAVSDKNSKSMDEFLKEYEISCAFLWSHCGETYSYVFYEMALAGTFVITNSYSGNVSDEVMDKGNGIVFDSFDAAMSWLSNPDVVMEKINEYRSSNKFAPKTVNENTDLLLPRSIAKTVQNHKLPKKNYFWTLVYCIKHMLINKGENRMHSLLSDCYGKDYKWI
ncbi:glycosyltransferase [Robinsoniella peoriensis]|uniref:glycosyltransferase n=1 Tax=Robinsoniella peoriensis TaxID=180332 RepID=UPI00085BDAD8|nr:glycosyltransferase [Robinsoniella peoriensis]